MNYIKTTILLVALTLLLVWIGGMIGGEQGMVFALIFAAIMNFGAFWFSDKIVLAMYQAKEVSKSSAPDFYALVKDVTMRANLPMPKLYIIPQAGANAFATGRSPKHAAVAITEGIKSLLTDAELKGVIAHELAHIKNRDILTATIVATIAGAVMMLANMARWAAMFGGSSRDDRNNSNPIGLIIVSILAPLAAMLIQLAISRSREYAADETGAKFLGSGMLLAGALRKLQTQSRVHPISATQNTAHLFIVSPLSGKDMFVSLFSTHPPLEKRIERLQNLIIS